MDMEFFNLRTEFSWKVEIFVTDPRVLQISGLFFTFAAHDMYICVTVPSLWIVKKCFHVNLHVLGLKSVDFLSCIVIKSVTHDDVIKWKHFPRYWPFVRGIHRSTVNSPHKGQ